MKRATFVLLGLLFACSEGQPEPEPITLADLMKTHFTHAEDMRDAIVNGDFVSLHNGAQAISKPLRVADLPNRWSEHLDGMRASARKIDGEFNIERAAAGFAEVARNCATCHQTTGTTPPLAEYPAPPVGADAKTHMLRHAWAAARMWEGLIVPSDERWLQGASLIAEESPVHTQGSATLSILSKELHALGKMAARATTQEERSRIYGSYISRCAGCHSAARSLLPSS